MQTLTEKRVFGSKHGTTDVFVASETGLLGVTVSADQIGEFGLVARDETTAVAAGEGGILAGTKRGVQYSPADAYQSTTNQSTTDQAATDQSTTDQSTTDQSTTDQSTTDQSTTDQSTAQSRSFEPVGGESLGKIVDLTWAPAGPVAATATQVWVPTEWPTTDAWEPVGECAEIRAVSGPLVAASDGVYRLGQEGLDHVGLTDVNDVTAHGTPLAATSEGLFSLGNGWQQVAPGAFGCVGSDGHGHAHAVGETILHRSTATDEWIEDELPVDSRVVDIAYGGGVVAAISANGTLCLAAGDGWRQQLLGVRGVRGVAVAPGD